MLRIFLALWLAVMPGFAWAGSMTLLKAGSASSAPVTYTGPGDINTSPVVWYGLRAFSSATRGNASINLCDDTGANCSDVMTSATTGNLNSPGTHGSNNCATSGTCRVAIIYDQSGAASCSGACNLSDSTNANRPTLLWNCIGSLPCMQFNGTSAKMASSANVTLTVQPFTVSVAYERTSNTGSFGVLLTENSTPTGLLAANAANEVTLFAGSVTTAPANDNAYHAVQGTLSNTISNNLYVDGSASTVTPGITGWTADIIVMGEDSSSRLFGGNMLEAGTWAGDQTANNSAMNSNQHTYWGF